MCTEVTFSLNIDTSPLMRSTAIINYLLVTTSTVCRYKPIVCSFLSEQSGGVQAVSRVTRVNTTLLHSHLSELLGFFHQSTAALSSPPTVHFIRVCFILTGQTHDP